MYNCEICNIQYKSRMGLYKHKIKHHITLQEPKEKHYVCTYCKKEFNHKQNKWRHEQTCKEKDPSIDIKTMKNEIAQLKQELRELKSKPTNISQTINNISGNTINAISNNGHINNNMTMVYPLGKEPINFMPEAEVIETLETHGINAITVLCKKKHFNPEKPELHNFCVTAKNDPYAIIVDPETKRTKSVNKKEVFDKAYYGLVINIDSVQTPIPEINETKDKIKAISMSKPMLKQVHLAFNQEAYHNKDMVQKTWSNAIFTEEQKKPIQEKPSKTRQQLLAEFGELLEDVKNGFEIEI